MIPLLFLYFSQCLDYFVLVTEITWCVRKLAISIIQICLLSVWPCVRSCKCDSTDGQCTPPLLLLELIALCKFVTKLFILLSALGTRPGLFICRLSCGSCNIYVISMATSPMQASGHNAPLILFLILALYILFASLYRMLPQLSYFLHFFLNCLFPYFSFPLRIHPLHFHAGCRKRWLNLALVFLCLFCVVVRFFWLVNACCCCVRFSFFSYQAKRLARGNVTEMTCIVSSGA